MLEKLIFISFLSLILTHNFADLRNFMKKPPMPKDIIELKESSQTQNNKSSEGLENNIQINGRDIPTNYGIYITDNYQKITISDYKVYFDISQKLYSVCSPSSYNIQYYIYTDGKPLDLTVVEVSLQGKGQVNPLMDDQKTYIKLVGFFYNGDIITIRYTYYQNLNYRFYIQFPLIVYNYYGICKLSLEVGDDFSILGTMNGTLPLVNKKIYYENACPEKSFVEYAIVSPYAVRWNSYFSRNVVSNSYNQNLELIFPRTALGGNNFIMENKIETKFVDYIDNNYVKSNITHYIFTYPVLTKGNVNTKISVDFINSVDNEIEYAQPSNSFNSNIDVEIDEKEDNKEITIGTKVSATNDIYINATDAYNKENSMTTYYPISDEREVSLIYYKNSEGDTELISNDNKEKIAELKKLKYDVIAYCLDNVTQNIGEGWYNVDDVKVLVK